MTIPLKCEAWKRTNDFFVPWVQCINDATVMLTVPKAAISGQPLTDSLETRIYDGETETVPVCNNCCQECVRSKVAIINAELLPARRIAPKPKDSFDDGFLEDFDSSIRDAYKMLVVPEGNWHTELAEMLNKARDGDTLIVHSVELAERARQRLAPNKNVNFVAKGMLSTQ